MRLAMRLIVVAALATSVGAEQRSMLQLLRVPDPAAAAAVETNGADWLAALRQGGRAADAGAGPKPELLVPIPPVPISGSRFRGRGIVAAVNGRDPVMLASAFALVRVVRSQFGSDLPIELFHLGPEERFPAEAAARFKSEGHVSILDLHAAARRSYSQWYDHDGLRDHRLPGAPPEPSAAADPLAKKRGWHVKPLAALVSSFEQVLVLDADALPLQHPARFFEHPVLRPPAGGGSTGGMLLFRDHVHCLTSVSAWLLTQLGLAPEAFCKAAGGQEIDSSAVVVDKSNPAVWKALHLAEALNRRWHKGSDLHLK